MSHLLLRDRIISINFGEQDILLLGLVWNLLWTLTTNTVLKNLVYTQHKKIINGLHSTLVRRVSNCFSLTNTQDILLLQESVEDFLQWRKRCHYCIVFDKNGNASQCKLGLNTMHIFRGERSIPTNSRVCGKLTIIPEFED